MLSEVKRVLKPGGQFAIMLEVIEGDSKWTNVVEGMIVYPPEQLKDMLEQAGFSDVEVFRRKPSYATIKGILEKYRSVMKEPKGKVFPYRSDQQVNNDLKKLCRKIGLNEPVNIVRYYGNKRHTTTMKKCDAISTHAGRRTFICLAIELGILPVVIREWTGHSTDKAMKPYISVTNKKKAREMSKFDSF